MTTGSLHPKLMTSRGGVDKLIEGACTHSCHLAIHVVTHTYQPTHTSVHTQSMVTFTHSCCAHRRSPQTKGNTYTASHFHHEVSDISLNKTHRYQPQWLQCQCRCATHSSRDNRSMHPETPSMHMYILKQTV